MSEEQKQTDKAIAYNAAVNPWKDEVRKNENLCSRIESLEKVCQAATGLKMLVEGYIDTNPHLVKCFEILQKEIQRHRKEWGDGDG